MAWPERTISAGRARRIALTAQGFATPRPAGAVTARHLRGVIDRLAVIQLDSVNVVCRAHYLPFFSRLGAYDRALLDRLAVHGDGQSVQSGSIPSPDERELFEYWAHEASLVPVSLHPYLRWRMATEHPWGNIRAVTRDRPHLRHDVLTTVSAHGPLRAKALGPELGLELGMEPAVRTPGQMWNWHDGKVILESLFWGGELTAARRVNFERHYDLSARVLPPGVLAIGTPAPEQAHRELIRRAARAYGIATEADLGDYFRLPRAASRRAVAELAEAGELVAVRVEGWDAVAYLDAASFGSDARLRPITARALICPFDPLVWFRERAERLFGFRYRIEIYVPQAKRQFGYYVLPFLLGEHLAARGDLKADRAAGVLRVQASYLEPGHDPEYVTSELAGELARAAAWLGLRDVAVAPRGDAYAALARHF